MFAIPDPDQARIEPDPIIRPPEPVAIISSHLNHMNAKSNIQVLPNDHAWLEFYTNIQHYPPQTTDLLSSTSSESEHTLRTENKRKNEGKLPVSKKKKKKRRRKGKSTDNNVSFYDHPDPMSNPIGTVDQEVDSFENILELAMKHSESK